MIVAGGLKSDSLTCASICVEICGPETRVEVVPYTYGGMVTIVIRSRLDAMTTNVTSVTNLMHPSPPLT